MNDRIKELLNEATSGLEPDLSLQRTVTLNEMQKFAELIVRECLGIVQDAERGGSNEIWDNAVKFIRRDLQEHFGVEQ
jgi:hypothetical protein